MNEAEGFRRSFAKGHPLARPCGICTAENRDDIDARLLTGEAVSDIAADSSFSASSLYRHRRQHMSATLLGERRASEDFGTLDLLESLADNLRDVAAVRGHALATGNPSMLLRAAATSERIIASLMEHLGTDEGEVLELLARGDALAVAIVRATRKNPEVGAHIAAELDQQSNAKELAEGLRRFTTSVALEAEKEKQK